MGERSHTHVEAEPFVIAASDSSFGTVGTLSVHGIAYACAREHDCDFEFEKTNYGHFSVQIHDAIRTLNAERKIEIDNGKIRLIWANIDRAAIAGGLEESREKVKRIFEKYQNLYNLTQGIAEV